MYSRVAATKTPIMFIGTGEHLYDLERFSPGPFISKMLGMGDLSGLLEHVSEVQNAPGADGSTKREEMMKKMEAGIFSIRDMRDQLNNVMSMGPLSKIAGMIPGMGDLLSAGGAGGEEDAGKRMKRLLYIMDAMTTEELDSDGKMFQNTPKAPKSKAVATSSSSKAAKSANASGKAKSTASSEASTSKSALREGQPRRANRNVIRVARGSGTSVREVEELLSQHQMFSQMVKKAGGKQGWMAKAQQAAGGRGGAGAGRGMPSQAQIQAAQQRMASMGMGGMDMGKMMQAMGGGGGGGMPDMASIQKMAQSMGMGGMFGR